MKMYKCAAKSLSLEPSNPAFTPSHDWNILSSKKIRLCQLNQSFLYCLRSEIVLLQHEFYLLRQGRLYDLWLPSCFCQINLEKCYRAKLNSG